MRKRAVHRMWLLHLTTREVLSIVLPTIPARPPNNAQIGGLLFSRGSR